MSASPNYRRATNEAYQILLRFKAIGTVETTLYTDVFEIAERMENVKILSYTELCNRFSVDRSFIYSLNISSHGFTLKRAQQSMIIYNDKKDERAMRFTIAHEIGHIVLKHTDDDDISDHEANCFARNLLCPVPVAKLLNLSSADDYSQVFKVSEQMANVAFNLSKNDFYYIDAKNYNAIKSSLRAQIA